MSHLERELPEMRALLKKHGFDPSDAKRLAAEGMGPYELEDRLRHQAGSVGSLEYTHDLKRHLTPYKKFIAKHGIKDGIPHRGFCISDRSGANYNACFLNKLLARRGAQLLADEAGRDVDIVQVQNRGEDRFIVGNVEPSWRKR